MATYYFICCDRCKEKADAASVSGGLPAGRLGDSLELLPAFIVYHAGCRALRIVDEIDLFSIGYQKWSLANLLDLWARPKPAQEPDLVALKLEQEQHI